MTESNIPPVSVIIPMYNDSDRQDRCLKVLDNQIYTKERYYGVGFVVNASDENIESVVKSFRQARSSLEACLGSQTH